MTGALRFVKADGVFQVAAEGAKFASGDTALAIVLGDLDDEGMELIVGLGEFGARRLGHRRGYVDDGAEDFLGRLRAEFDRGRGERGFDDGGRGLLQGLLDHLANGVVLGAGLDESVAVEDAAGVRVDDEDLVLVRVEEDGIGRLGTDAFQGEEFEAEAGGGPGEHLGEGALVGLVKPRDKAFEAG